MEIKKLKELEERINKREDMKTAFEYVLRDLEEGELRLNLDVSNHSLDSNGKRGGLYIHSLFKDYLHKAILTHLPELVKDAISFEEEDFEHLKEKATNEAIAVIKGDV